MTKKQILGKWKELKKQLVSEGIEADDIIKALKELYSVYETSLLEWLGNLFDSDIGGFYYSNSASESDGFFPDIESTGQAIGILESSGAIGSYKDIPETVRTKIACFICSCEDPESGYFYNPQWSREDTDKKISRRSRDSRWAVDIAEMCNFEVPYPTVFSKIENGYHGNLPDYLKDKKSFSDFLNSLNTKKELHKSIHTVFSQYDQIFKLGYTDIAFDFIEGLRNSETNLFGNSNTNKIATMKILRTVTCFYYFAKRKMPYTKEVADFALECIASPEYNDMAYMSACWDALAKSVVMLSEYDGATGRKTAKEIIKNNIHILPEYIRFTSEKLRKFKKQDGSFSYNASGFSRSSQGMIVAKEGCFEGDVNGTTLAVLIPSSIITFLSLKDNSIPLYDFNDFEVFIKNVK